MEMDATEFFDGDQMADREYGGGPDSMVTGGVEGNAG